MSDKLMSILNTHDSRLAITINCEDLMSFVDKIRELAREEAHAAYRKKLSSEFYTRQELMDIYKISESVLAKWYRIGFLTPVKIGGKTLYRKSDVERIVTDFELR